MEDRTFNTTNTRLAEKWNGTYFRDGRLGRSYKRRNERVDTSADGPLANTVEPEDQTCHRGVSVTPSNEFDQNIVPSSPETSSCISTGTRIPPSPSLLIDSTYFKMFRIRSRSRLPLDLTSEEDGQENTGGEIMEVPQEGSNIGNPPVSDISTATAPASDKHSVVTSPLPNSHHILPLLHPSRVVSPFQPVIPVITVQNSTLTDGRREQTSDLDPTSYETTVEALDHAASAPRASIDISGKIMPKNPSTFSKEYIKALEGLMKGVPIDPNDFGKREYCDQPATSKSKSTPRSINLSHEDINMPLDPPQAHTPSPRGNPSPPRKELSPPTTPGRHTHSLERNLLSPNADPSTPNNGSSVKKGKSSSAKEETTPSKTISLSPNRNSPALAIGSFGPEEYFSPPEVDSPTRRERALPIPFAISPTPAPNSGVKSTAITSPAKRKLAETAPRMESRYFNQLDGTGTKKLDNLTATPAASASGPIPVTNATASSSTSSNIPPAARPPFIREEINDHLMRELKYQRQASHRICRELHLGAAGIDRQVEEHQRSWAIEKAKLDAESDELTAIKEQKIKAREKEEGEEEKEEEGEDLVHPKNKKQKQTEKAPEMEAVDRINSVISDHNPKYKYIPLLHRKQEDGPDEFRVDNTPFVFFDDVDAFELMDYECFFCRCTGCACRSKEPPEVLVRSEDEKPALAFHIDDPLRKLYVPLRWCACTPCQENGIVTCTTDPSNKLHFAVRQGKSGGTVFNPLNEKVDKVIPSLESELSFRLTDKATMKKVKEMQDKSVIDSTLANSTRVVSFENRTFVVNREYSSSDHYFGIEGSEYEKHNSLQSVIQYCNDNHRKYVKVTGGVLDDSKYKPAPKRDVELSPLQFTRCCPVYIASGQELQSSVEIIEQAFCVKAPQWTLQKLVPHRGSLIFCVSQEQVLKSLPENKKAVPVEDRPWLKYFADDAKDGAAFWKRQKMVTDKIKSYPKGLFEEKLSRENIYGKLDDSATMFPADIIPELVESLLKVRGSEQFKMTKVHIKTSHSYNNQSVLPLQTIPNLLYDAPDEVNYHVDQDISPEWKRILHGTMTLGDVNQRLPMTSTVGETFVLYHHVWGCPRVWWSILEKDKEKLRKVLELPEHDNCPQPFSHHNDFLNPSMLKNLNIIPIANVQYQGQIVMFAPGALYQALDLGPNVVERAHLITDKWEYIAEDLQLCSHDKAGKLNQALREHIKDTRGVRVSDDHDMEDDDD